MQDRYTGDIGDFGKYGLLHALCTREQEGALKLGVNWYLVPDRGNPNEGNFVDYLCENARQASLKKSCPRLYFLLQGIVFPGKNDLGLSQQVKAEAHNCVRRSCVAGKDPGRCMLKRCITKVEERGILPGETVFYNKVLHYPAKSQLGERKQIRDSWVQAGFNLLADCGLVFFDPDNGLQTPSSGRYSQEGVKYVFEDEIARYYKRGQSIVIYQHRSREPQAGYLGRISKSVVNITGRESINSIRLRYRRGTARDFIIIPNHHSPGHQELIEARIDKMLQTPWGDHFEKYYLDQ